MSGSAFRDYGVPIPIKGNDLLEDGQFSGEETGEEEEGKGELSWK